MNAPAQGSLALLEDPAAVAMLQSTSPAHLAFNWRDGTPRCTPIWFHWDGRRVVMAGPAGAPRAAVLTTGTPAAVTIDSSTFPYQVLMLRGTLEVDEVEGVAPEYRLAAIRYFGEEQGSAWCDQMPAGVRMVRTALVPTWVGVLDFDGMRRLPSALAG